MRLLRHSWEVVCILSINHPSYVSDFRVSADHTLIPGRTANTVQHRIRKLKATTKKDRRSNRHGAVDNIAEVKKSSTVKKSSPKRETAVAEFPTRQTDGQVEAEEKD